MLLTIPASTDEHEKRARSSQTWWMMVRMGVRTRKHHEKDKPIVFIYTGQSSASLIVASGVELTTIAGPILWVPVSARHWKLVPVYEPTVHSHSTSVLCWEQVLEMPLVWCQEKTSNHAGCYL
jgi:hypothetical protein